MDKNEIFYRRCAAMLVMGYFLAMTTPAFAEENRGRGMMSVTFHENSARHAKSENFHVVMEDGQVRWQNFKSKERESWGGPRKVYEMKEGSTPRDALTTGFQEKEAVARR